MLAGVIRITADRKALPGNGEQTIGVTVFKIAQWNLLDHNANADIAKVSYVTSRSLT